MKVILVAIGLIFVSGASNGLHETILYHYSAFQSKFPKATEQYWNPQVSWKNKYKNYPDDKRPAFWGSTTIFVVFTDAKHLLSEAHRDFLMLALVLLCGVLKPNKWWAYLILFIATHLIQTAGFHLVYTLIF